MTKKKIKKATPLYVNYSTKLFFISINETQVTLNTSYHPRLGKMNVSLFTQSKLKLVRSH